MCLQKIKRELVLTGLNRFKEGAMENFNPDLPIDEQAELLPYDKKWEFPRDRLKMGRFQHFGNVNSDCLQVVMEF
ncbi:hypothetical protein PR048_000308 [Dryococelus australis]|uniref:Uncharacterized protein n=1 Tax=Dryococelus australis TaxID=614101 RepID=A0ABQ9IFG4_9NEOP|nr:hypothetical protein PR048_000308 [Dryococelus australis]